MVGCTLASALSADAASWPIDGSAEADTPLTRSTICSRVMARLRDPETAAVRGTSSRASRRIAPYTIEEAYEVADAIARDDLDALKDELGDLLLQVVYHAQMAAEERTLRLRRCGRMPSRAR